MGGDPALCSSVVSVLLILLCAGLSLHANARPSIKITSTVVDQICSKSINSSFCLNVLNSDPRTRTVDLKQLAQITINYAQTNVSSNQKLIQSLSSHATDPKLKERYDDCADHYDEATGNIEYALERLNSGDFPGTNIAVSAVFTDVDDCEEEWKTPPADPSQLSTKNKDLKDLLDISLVISNLL
ncbi:hypothetical protein FNV43_RR01065 [Rhamnella rubrinervis]|uniref:Pectinesterase inhibitor domain-containing protein n=1 Tax=Rhamnella rubrinervis TaxID=2594499 RepID=A0A8K0HPU1_9ROSA|nr:hypothetical protein FNV43_RR01065 [Rhamnella rubrinervis]